MFKKETSLQFIIFLTIVVLQLTLFGSCEQPFDFTEILDGADGKALTIEPGSVTLLTDETYELEASGGMPPYQFEVTKGEGDVEKKTGKYTAPASPGEAEVQVMDSYGISRVAKITITEGGGSGLSELNLSPSSISVITGQTIQFEGTGGDPGYSYAVTTNNSGGSINSSGLYTAGMSAGTDTITITDSSSDTDTATVTVSATTADVDYEVSFVTNTGGTTGGGAISGEFEFTNSGTTDGTQTVTWTAYVSIDNLLSGGDTQIDTGTTTQLISGGLSGAIAFTGTWPSFDGTYYLIISLSAPDDGNINNNSGSSPAVAVTGTPPPDIDYVVTTVSAGGTPATTGTSISETFDIQNQGTENGSDTVYWTAYRSTDITLDGGDVVIDSGTTGALNGGATAAGIGFTGTWPDTSGTYYLIVNVSSSDEGTTTNNNASSGAFTINNPDIDYIVTTVSNTGTPATAGSAINETFTVQNQGADNGTRTVYWNAYVSTDTILDKPGDDPVDNGSTAALASGGSTAGIAIDGTWPGTAGTYYLIVEVSAGDESVTGNNDTASGSFTLNPPAIDYVVASVSNTGTPALAGSAINETFTVQNQGADNGSQTVYWNAYVSTDTILDKPGDDPVDNGSTTALASGATSGAITINNGNWPSSPGTYYLIVEVSSSDESVAGNNDGASGAFNITAPDIDYQVDTVTNANNPANVSTAISETFDFTNYGADNGGSTVYWYAYYSTDTTYDAGDTLFDSGIQPALTSGASANGIAVSGTWPGTAGNYYIIVKLSASDESDATNNTGASAAFTLSAPSSIDYVVTNVTKDYPTVPVSSPISEKFSVQNIGDTPGTQNINWNAYVSMDTVHDGGDTNLSSGTITGGLAAGATASNISIGGTWNTTSGNQYLIIVLSPAADETETSNNEGYSGTFNVYDPPDYSISPVSIPSHSLAGSALNGSFDIVENNGFEGNMIINWEVYLSDDPGLGSDTLIQSGTHAPLPAGGSTAPSIDFSDNWPAASGEYYLIIKIDADDDNTSGNDMYVSNKIWVYDFDEDEAGGNDATGPTDTSPPNPAPLSPVRDVGILNLDERIIIYGTMDASSPYYDTIRFTISTGEGVTEVSTYAEWFTGANDVDLYMWDDLENGWEATSFDTEINREPSVGMMTVTGWSDGEGGYVSAYFPGAIGPEYILVIEGH